MIRLNFQLKIEKPKWFAKMFRCKHNVVIVEENTQSRYGAHTSYMYCMKCGRKAMAISQHCKHDVDPFGKCIHCLDRIEKHDCLHEKWNKEPDTDDYWCNNCGEWKNDI